MPTLTADCTVVFDSNISKVEIYTDINFTSLFTTISSSNGSFRSRLGGSFYFKVYLSQMYEIDNVSSSAQLASISDLTSNTFNLWLRSPCTITITSKLATPRISVDLTTLSGWESLSTGSHNITVVAKADGYRDSEPSEAVSVTKAATMPAKGDIITIEDKQYRVLKMNGTVAEVLCMYDANRSIAFDSASSNYNDTYAGKNIDTYCNNTFYSGLSAAMKSAIVDKTFTQDSWMYQNSAPTESHYTGKYSSSTYYLTLVNAAYGSSITRHCYCLSVQDVLDYLEATTSMGTSDTTLTDTNIWKMFWNVTTSLWKDIWLRSAYSSRSDCAFVVIGNIGNLGYNDVYGTFAARPAFQIDLSKISWS